MSAERVYQLKFRGLTKELLQRLRVDADAAGITERVGRTLIEIEGHLELHPKEWGDPLKCIAAFRQTIYRRIYDGLCVEYSVHDSEPYVWLNRIYPVLGHPLCTLDEH